MRRFHPVAVLFCAALLAPIASCTSGAADGQPCTYGSDCSSGLCIAISGANRCATRCTPGVSTCAAGQICGRFDFRALDFDSGMPVGDPSDVVTVCRPPLDTPCDAAHPCGAPGMVCSGATGVCTTSCTCDGACASRLCLANGVCAPPCDAISECPQPGYYCNLAFTDAQGHGRCEPTAGGAGMSCATDAGTTE